MKISLDKKTRQQEILLPGKVKKLKFEVSREDCRDVLVEFVDSNDNGKSKPLSKCLDEMKLKNISKIRFIMNEMSAKPIEISLIF